MLLGLCLPVSRHDLGISAQTPSIDRTYPPILFLSALFPSHQQAPRITLPRPYQEINLQRHRMKFARALLGLAGIASATNIPKIPTSLADLGDGSKSTTLRYPPRGLEAFTYQAFHSPRPSLCFPSPRQYSSSNYEYKNISLCQNANPLLYLVYTIPFINNTMDISHAIRDAYTPRIRDSSVSVHPTNPANPALSARRQPGICDPQFPTRTTFCRFRRISREEYQRAYIKYVDWVENGPDAGWIPKHSCKTLVSGLVAVSGCSRGGPNPSCRAELDEAMRELDTYCDDDQGGDIYIHRWKKRYTRHHLLDGDGLVVAQAEAEAEAS
ncbi:hypothetical protein F5Y13DRAFT_87025 [Hypoxylon sp. FL1857]|nr:hypothetical protein F5Y13DRAFT_87025 [Hypoxylon sp. FL1857]